MSQGMMMKKSHLMYPSGTCFYKGDEYWVEIGNRFPERIWVHNIFSLVCIHLAIFLFSTFPLDILHHSILFTLFLFQHFLCHLFFFLIPLPFPSFLSIVALFLAFLVACCAFSCFPFIRGFVFPLSSIVWRVFIVSLSNTFLYSTNVFSHNFDLYNSRYRVQTCGKYTLNDAVQSCKMHEILATSMRY